MLLNFRTMNSLRLLKTSNGQRNKIAAPPSILKPISLIIYSLLPSLPTQVFGCCTRKLRSSEFWLSLITLFLILIYEASRAPFELFNIHHILTNWANIGPLDPFIPNIDSEPYVAVMKWAVYAPALLHPLLYFTFSPEARHGVYILFSRMCSCCCSKSDRDVEVASDDEKGRMLGSGKGAAGEDEAPGNNGGQVSEE